MNDVALFKKFKPFLCETKPNADYPETLKMFEVEALSVYYSPFDYVNKDARLTIVGITPGHTQAEKMNLEAVRLMKTGCSDKQILKLCKPVGSFSGTLRTLLVTQLNFFKFNEYLGIKDCASIFDKDSHLVNYTSIYKFPVFYNDGKRAQLNFNGGSKQGSKTARKELLSYFKDYASAEFKAVSNSIIVPLGPVVEKIMQDMNFSQDIQERITPKILHASGNNQTRIAYLIGKRARENMRVPNSPGPVDELKHELQSFMSRKFNI